MRLLNSLVLLFVMPLMAVAGNVSVKGFTAQQRYPWNGLVDIVVTLQGESNDVVSAECSFVATNSATGAAIPVEHITRNGTDSFSGSVWARKFIWDVKADVGAVKIDAVALTVAVEISLGGVQLWENGPYWAECNVGATRPEECGYYFWWGDTVGYERVDESWNAADGARTGFAFNSVFCGTFGRSYTQLQGWGYTDSTGNLVDGHDAAVKHHGVPWRMPTDAEFAALVSNCTIKCAIRNGVNGLLISGNGDSASKSIFLPAVGYGNDYNRISFGSVGRYWSSTPHTDGSWDSWCFAFGPGYFIRDWDSRGLGYSVRPVRESSNRDFTSEGVTTHLYLSGENGIYKEMVNGVEWTFVVTAEAEASVGSGTREGTAIDNRTADDIIVPLKLGGCPVTKISDHAFHGCNKIKSITLHKGIVSIGHDAFLGCSGLETLTIPSCVTKMSTTFHSIYQEVRDVRLLDDFTRIEDRMFDGCVMLKSVKIPTTVTSIGDSAFEGCSWLTSVSIPGGVTSIGYGVFSGCSGLTSVTIPSSVTSIGDEAFKWCSGITSVTIPLSVTSIGYGAFSGCSGLTSVTIPEGVTSIGDHAFSNCYGLTSVTIPSSVTSIGSWAFYGCCGLTSVTIPSSVTSIGNSAFEYCSGLMSFAVDTENSNYSSPNGLLCSKDGKTLILGVNGNVTIPESVTSIGGWAFSGCGGLTSVTIPSSVTSVEYGAFSGCSGLTEVTMPSSVGKLSSIFPSAYQQIKKVVIADGTTSVCDYAFDWCTGLEVVIIPAGVASVGNYAFRWCDKLSFITLPDGVQTIGDHAFSDCSKLRSVNIPSSVTWIGKEAFAGCSGLVSICVDGNNSVYCSLDDVLYNKAMTELIKYPSLKFGEAIVPSTVTTIDSYAFYWCGGLTSVKIPDSIEYIGEHAFEGCEQLVSVTIFKGQEKTPDEPRVGNYAFYYCNSLSVVFVDDEPPGWVKRCFGDTVIYQKIGTPVENVFEFSCANNEATVIGVQPGLGEVVIPQTTDGVVVTRIGNDAFKYRAGLTSVVIPSGVVRIGNGAFYGCCGLEFISVDSANESFEVVNGCLMSKDGVTLVRGPAQSAVTIPDGVKSISSFAFESCGSLKSIVIPSSVTDIGEAAFQKCRALGSITIHKSVSYVGFCAFAQCDNLTTVYVDVGDTYRVKQMLERSDGIDDVRLLNFVEQDDLPEIEPVVTNTITYLNMQGSANPNPATFTAKDLPLTLTPLTRDGYEFLGWTPNGGVIPVGTVTNVTFTAEWGKPIECQVKENLNCDNLTFILGGDAPHWYGVQAARADKVGMMRSGAIGDSQTNWIETVVSGAGTIGFWWKASGEYEETKKGLMRYDYAEFTIDGVAVGEIGDESDWTYMTIPVEGAGSHILRWMYHKDESGLDGDDCAWLSEVSWEPTQVAEPIPELPENPTTEDVQSALAGSADNALLVHVTDAAIYNAYREWALKIGAAEVKASPFAWVSFATDSAALLAKMPMDGDLKVEEFKPSATAGSFDFTVSVKDVTIGDKASEDNLKKLFGLEGAASLESAAFSSENVVLKFKEPQDGKLKFTATPAVDNAKSFFMKVKVK